MVDAHDLGRVDLSKTINNALFSPSRAERISRTLRKCAPTLSASYFVSAMLFPAVMLAPSRIAQPLAMIEAVLEFPVYCATFLSLRVDLVRLLVVSYDWWFFTAVTMLFVVVFSQFLGDLRAILVVSRWIGFQVPVLIDANMNQAGGLLVGIALNMVLLVGTMMGVTFNVISDVAVAAELESTASPRFLSVRDMVVNSMVNMLILLGRIMIRKRKFARSLLAKAPSRDVTNAVPRTAVTVQCVALKCSIRLCAVGDQKSRSASPQRAVSAPPCSRALPDTEGSGTPCPPTRVRNVQLRRTATTTKYDATKIVFPSLLQVKITSWRKRLLFSTGSAGMILSLVACVGALSGQFSRAALAVSFGGLLCSLVFVTVWIGFSNRKLLAEICSSFDFVFLSIQITIAHVCVSDMLQWHVGSTIAVASAWIWIHWVLTLDALTPVVKESLGFHIQWCAAPVLVLYFAGQLSIYAAGLLWNWWNSRDRIIWSGNVLGKHVAFQIVPLFANRMITISMWTLRLLWRIYRDPHPDKLILLRGQVEFEYELHSHASRQGQVKITSVVPAPKRPTDSNILGKHSRRELRETAMIK